MAAGLRHSPTPIQARYSAPVAVKAVSRAGLRATRAPTPAATASVASSAPQARPSVAGSTSRRPRRPAEIT
jgi:hypothetical protein